MDLMKRVPVQDLDIEIIEPEKVHSNGYIKFSNNNQKGTHGAIGDLQTTEENLLVNESQGSEDDYLVIELIDDKGNVNEVKDDIDSYVDINLTSSEQLLVYLARKPRLYIRCRARAVTHTALFKRCTSKDFNVFLKPCYRISIRKTHNWYYNYCHTMYLQPVKRSVKRKPVHYTEKVECRDRSLDSLDRSKNKDPSGYQLTFVDESNQQVSKLTLSADFTLSYEEKSSKLKDVQRDIDFLDEKEDRPSMLKRSYSIEFLNEDQSFSAERVASQMEQGEGHEIYVDSDDEYQSSEEIVSDQHNQSALKRSYSIEFLNEQDDEQQVFSSEVVSYKISKGEGTLIYSDVEHQSMTEESYGEKSRDEEQTSLKRSYSIEFLDDSQDKRADFSYETISSKIEKGEGRLIYDDSESQGVSDHSQNKAKKTRTPSQKLKTLDVRMNANEEEENVPLRKQNKAYSIEFLNERENNFIATFEDDDVEDEIACAEVFVDQQESGINFFEEEDDTDVEDEDREDSSLHEKRAYSIEFLDEEDDTLPMFEETQTSTPSKRSKPPSSPRKSPLQTISIGLEFEKRNRLEEEENEMFVNDADDYLLYDDSSIGKEGNKTENGHKHLSNLKLETVVVDMDTHHKLKRPSMQSDRNYQLEFQKEEERRMSLIQNKAQRSRLSSDPSSPLRTVSVENDSEGIEEDTERQQQAPRVLKKKWYSVELLNELDGDRSVFAEEIDDDGRWTLDV